MGGGGQATRSSKRDAGSSADGAAPGKTELFIDGRFYDVTSFMRRHPGGSIIKFGVGTDATFSFMEFHGRSPRAHRLLKALPSREARPDEVPAQAREDVMKDYAELRRELEAEGMFRPAPLHMTYRALELVGMHALGVALLMSGWWAAGVLVLGIAQGRCGWFMHEAGHYSVTGVSWLDRRIQELAYGMGCGMSAAFWRNQHNKHHATPQQLGKDVDLDTLPLVAFNAAVASMRPKLASKPWLRLQAFLFAPVTCLVVALGWQLFLHPRHSLRIGNFAELAWLAARYVGAAYLLSSVLGYSAGFAVFTYLAYVWVGSVYIFVNFALSHTHHPVIPKTESYDWVRYAALTTTNIQPSFWCDWWMGYLNYQIEHHLFPTMPQFRHRAIAPRVRALLEKHRLPYDCRPYFSAMRATFANLHKVGNEVFYG